eukprot:g4029.t1
MTSTASSTASSSSAFRKGVLYYEHDSRPFTHPGDPYILLETLGKKGVIAILCCTHIALLVAVAATVLTSTVLVTTCDLWCWAGRVGFEQLNPGASWAVEAKEEAACLVPRGQGYCNFTSPHLGKQSNDTTWISPVFVPGTSPSKFVSLNLYLGNVSESLRGAPIQFNIDIWLCSDPAKKTTATGGGGDDPAAAGGGGGGGGEKGGGGVAGGSSGGVGGGGDSGGGENPPAADLPPASSEEKDSICLQKALAAWSRSYDPDTASTLRPWSLAMPWRHYRNASMSSNSDIVSRTLFAGGEADGVVALLPDSGIDQEADYYQVRVVFVGAQTNSTTPRPTHDHPHPRPVVEPGWSLRDVGTPLKFEATFEGFGLRIAEVAIRVMLLVVNLCFFGFWIYQNKRRHTPWKEWLPERRWITFLFLVMAMWQDPVLMYAQINQRPGHDTLYTISSILEDSAAVFMLFFWLLLLSAIRHRQTSLKRFYAPKVVFAVVTLGAFYVEDLSRLLLVRRSDADDPDDDDPSAAAAETAFAVSVQDLLFWGNIVMLCCLALWVVYFTYLAFRTRNMLRKLPYCSTRFQQLSYSFFVFHSVLAIVFIICSQIASSNVRDIFSTGGSNSIALLSYTIDTHRVDRLGLVILFSVYSLVVAFTYLPPYAMPSKLRRDRGFVRLEQQLPRYRRLRLRQQSTASGLAGAAAGAGAGAAAAAAAGGAAQRPWGALLAAAAKEDDDEAKHEPGRPSFVPSSRGDSFEEATGRRMLSHDELAGDHHAAASFAGDSSVGGGGGGDIGAAAAAAAEAAMAPTTGQPKTKPPGATLKRGARRSTGSGRNTGGGSRRRSGGGR